MGIKSSRMTDDPAPTPPTFGELEHAAAEVIRHLKQVPGSRGDTRLAIIGGLALWHYLPDGRMTDVSLCFIPLLRHFFLAVPSHTVPTPHLELS